MKNFGYALLYLTGERFTLTPVMISGVDPFGNIQKSSPKDILNLTTKIPKILLEYQEPYRAILKTFHIYL